MDETENDEPVDVSLHDLGLIVAWAALMGVGIGLLVSWEDNIWPVGIFIMIVSALGLVGRFKHVREENGG